MFWFNNANTDSKVSEEITTIVKDNRERVDRFYKRLFELHDSGCIEEVSVSRLSRDVCYHVFIYFRKVHGDLTRDTISIYGNYSRSNCIKETKLDSWVSGWKLYLVDTDTQPSISIQNEFWDRFVATNIGEADENLYNEYANHLDRYAHPKLELGIKYSSSLFDGNPNSFYVVGISNEGKVVFLGRVNALPESIKEFYYRC